MVNEQDPLWAEELFAKQLSEALTAQQTAYDNFMKGDVEFAGDVVSDPPTDAAQRMKEIGRHVDRINALLTSSTVSTAFGSDGYSGDQTAVRLFASTLAGIYTDILQWGRATRAAQVPDEWTPVYLALSRFAESPLNAIADFAKDFTQRVTTIANDLVQHRSPTTTLALTLTVGLPDSYMDAYNAALAQMKKPATQKRRSWFSRK
jgi:hypothetical protein